MTDGTARPFSNDMRWLILGLCWAGCVTTVETLRRERTTAWLGPPRMEGPGAPRLTARSRGRWIEINAHLVRPCTRERTEIMDTYLENEVHGHGKLVGVLPVMAPFLLPSMILATAVGGSSHIIEERPRTDIHTECAEPLLGQRVHLRVEGGSELVAVVDESGRATFQLAAELPAQGLALASLDGTTLDIAVSYDADEGQRQCLTDQYEGPICPRGKHCGAGGRCQPDTAAK